MNWKIKMKREKLCHRCLSHHRRSSCCHLFAFDLFIHFRPPAPRSSAQVFSVLFTFSHFLHHALVLCIFYNARIGNRLGLVFLYFLIFALIVKLTVDTPQKTRNNPSMSWKITSMYLLMVWEN